MELQQTLQTAPIKHRTQLPLRFISIQTEQLQYVIAATAAAAAVETRFSQLSLLDPLAKTNFGI